MKAVIYEKFGPPEVLKISEVDKPVPKDNEILVKVHATTVHRGDIRMRKFDVPKGMWLVAGLFLGFRKPKKPILGMELSGVIEEVGKDVTLFNKGDEILASTTGSDLGGYAEYKCLPETTLIAKKPSNMTFEEAAAGLPTGGVTANNLIKRVEIKKGQQVLVYGASGGVGTYVVQLAKYLGAEVTGVCSSSNFELVKSLGADKVIDYTKEDFSQSEIKYDIVIDSVAKFPPSKAKLALKKGGTYLNVHKHSGGKIKREDLEFLLNIVEEGKLKAVIDRTYPLEDIIEAHKYVESERKKGNVVVIINKD